MSETEELLSDSDEGSGEGGFSASSRPLEAALAAEGPPEEEDEVNSWSPNAPRCSGREVGMGGGAVAHLYSTLKKSWFLKEAMLLLRLTLPIVRKQCPLLASGRLINSIYHLFNVAVLPKCPPADSSFHHSIICWPVQWLNRAQCNRYHIYDFFLTSLINFLLFGSPGKYSEFICKHSYSSYLHVLFFQVRQCHRFFSHHRTEHSSGHTVSTGEATPLPHPLNLTTVYIL